MYTVIIIITETRITTCGLSGGIHTYAGLRARYTIMSLGTPTPIISYLYPRINLTIIFSFGAI
jgi:hypothetical protein